MKYAQWLFILLALLAAAACGQAPQPTSLPATRVPVTLTPLPATMTRSLPQPSATPVPTQPPPTVTPTPLPTPTPTAVPLAILEPQPETAVPAGETLTISGTSPVSPLALRLHIGPRTLAAAEAAVAPDGSWTAALDLPPALGGWAALTLTAADMMQTIPLRVSLPAAAEAPVVALERPSPDAHAVAGYTIFFGGSVTNPIDGALSIGILADACTRFVARQTFTLGDGGWEGYLVLPVDTPPGAGCAVAYTGDWDAGGAVAMLSPLPLRTSDDPEAALLLLGNVGLDTLPAGGTALLFGTAVRAPDNRIELELSTDDGNLRRLAQAEIPVNSYGYWEYALTLPDDYRGYALLILSMGRNDDYRERRIPVEIE